MFHDLNARLIEAKKVCEEHQRIKDVLDALEQELVSEQMALSRAVTDLKWKIMALDKVNAVSLESLVNQLRGRKKEWVEDVRYAYEQSRAEHERRKRNLAAITQRQAQLQKQLESVADALPAYEAIHEQQIAYLVAQGGEYALKLLDVSSKIVACQEQEQRLAAIVDTGLQTVERLQTFVRDLLERSGHSRQIVGFSTTLWLLPVEVFVEILSNLPDEVALNNQVATLQTQFDVFQEQIAAIARQFWPPLSVKPIGGRSPEKIKLWLYHLQQIDNRLQTKLEQLQELISPLQAELEALHKNREQLVYIAWQAERKVFAGCP